MACHGNQGEVRQEMVEVKASSGHDITSDALIIIHVVIRGPIRKDGSAGEEAGSERRIRLGWEAKGQHGMINQFNGIVPGICSLLRPYGLWLIRWQRKLFHISSFKRRDSLNSYLI